MQIDKFKYIVFLLPYSKLTQRLEKLRTSASGSGQEKELVSLDSSSSCSSPRRNWSGSVLTDSDDEEDEFQDCLEFQTARDDQSSGPSSRLANSGKLSSIKIQPS